MQFSKTKSCSSVASCCSTSTCFWSRFLKTKERRSVCYWKALWLLLSESFCRIDIQPADRWRKTPQLRFLHSHTHQVGIFFFFWRNFISTLKHLKKKTKEKEKRSVSVSRRNFLNFLRLNLLQFLWDLFVLLVWFVIFLLFISTLQTETIPLWRQTHFVTGGEQRRSQRKFYRVSLSRRRLCWRRVKVHLIILNWSSSVYGLGGRFVCVQMRQWEDWRTSETMILQEGNI